MRSYDELGEAEAQAVQLAKLGLRRLLQQQFRHRAGRLYTVLITSRFIDVLAAADREPDLVRVVNLHLVGTSWEVTRRASL